MPWLKEVESLIKGDVLSDKATLKEYSIDASIFSIKPKELEHIKKASFNVIYTPAYTTITISLLKADQILKSNLVMPYSKKLALEV